MLGVSLHVGTVGFSHRNRDDVERRYQNPASCDAVVALPQTSPMLLGLWSEEDVPVVVAHDAQRRLGHGGTRVSLFIGLAALRLAASTGWAEYESSSGEQILAFVPHLFPLYAEMFANGAIVSEDRVSQVIASADALAPDLSGVERARRSTLVLAREYRFRSDVIQAYGGRCAMCGLALGLVQGAHIYPVNAPGSNDDVRNGLALCPNHHAAFDRYLIFVEPESLLLRHNPHLKELAMGSDAGAMFVAGTFASLMAPADHRLRPSDAMIRLRNDYFADSYQWARD